MKIRTLDRDISDNTLEIFRGNDGDVHVKITKVNDKDMDKNSAVVRIGMMGNSGVEMPARIRRLFGLLADEFAKYEDCEFETDAARCDKSNALIDEIAGTESFKELSGRMFHDFLNADISLVRKKYFNKIIDEINE